MKYKDFKKYLPKYKNHYGVFKPGDIKETRVHIAFAGGHYPGAWNANNPILNNYTVVEIYPIAPNRDQGILYVVLKERAPYGSR